METKNAQVRELVRQGEYKRALRLCKEWDYKNPAHRKALRLGYECLVSPRFYEQLGINPTKAYQDAVDVLKEVYKS